MQTNNSSFVIKNKFLPEIEGLNIEVIGILESIEPLFEFKMYKYKSVETINLFWFSAIVLE